jgi:threonine/homoserine/homoserine lactone efflux protein
MLRSVFGVVLGLGIAMALSPLPVLALVLLLSTKGGLRKGWAFVLGEFIVMFLIAIATIVLWSGTSRESASRPASWVTLAAGILLLGLGATWAFRLHRGASPKRPKWMATLDRMRPWPAFLLGTFLPTYTIAVAAGAHIVGVHPSSAAALGGVILFLVVGMSTVYTPVLLAQFAPERSAPVRARLREWLEHRWSNVAAVLLLVVGAALVSKGLIALG